MLPPVDLNLLRSLHALLEEDSVSEAARRLGVTQAAASNALARLRAHFEDPLLVRVGQRMVPTPLAEQLRPRVEAAMRAAELALATAAAFDPAGVRAEIRIATSDHIDAVVLEPLSAALAGAAPGLQLAVEPFSPSSVERTRRGEVGLLLAPRAHMSDGLRTTRLFEEPYAVVVRRDHPALSDSGGALTLDAFATLNHVVVAPGGGSGGEGLATQTRRALAEVGLDQQVRRTVASFSHALLLVATSDSVAVLPRSFAARFAGHLHLAVVPPPVPLPPSPIDAGWHPRFDADPLHTWVRVMSSRSRGGRSGVGTVEPSQVRRSLSPANASYNARWAARPSGPSRVGYSAIQPSSMGRLASCASRLGYLWGSQGRRRALAWHASTVASRNTSLSACWRANATRSA